MSLTLWGHGQGSKDLEWTGGFLRIKTDSWPLRDLASTAQMVATLALSRQGEQLPHADLALFPRAGLRAALPLCSLTRGLAGDCCVLTGELLRQLCGLSVARSPLGRDFRVKMVI